VKDFILIEFTTVQWGMVVLSAFLIGVSRSGLAGAGVLVVPLMALAMPENVKTSVGLTLGLLCISDLGAVIYWRKNCHWSMLRRIMPPTFMGVVLGAMFLDTISTNVMMGGVGVVCLAMMGIKLWLDQYKANHEMPTHWLFSSAIGVLAGIVSTLANAAGPLMVIYFLAKKYPKEKFIATSVWFFMLLNMFKIPFLRKMDLVTTSSLLTNLVLIPVIGIGLFVGIKFIKYIPQKIFNRIIQSLAAIGAAVLVVRSFMY